jgi:hypothetical protein
MTLCNNDFFVDLETAARDGNIIASFGHKPAQAEQPSIHTNGLTTKTLSSLTSKTP